jgi:hypothetical protein
MGGAGRGVRARRGRFLGSTAEFFGYLKIIQFPLMAGGGEITFSYLERDIRCGWSPQVMNAIQVAIGLRWVNREIHTARRRFRRCHVYTGVWTFRSGIARRISTCVTHSFLVR